MKWIIKEYKWPMREKTTSRNGPEYHKIPDKDSY